MEFWILSTFWPFSPTILYIFHHFHHFSIFWTFKIFFHYFGTLNIFNILDFFQHFEHFPPFFNILDTLNIFNNRLYQCSWFFQQFLLSSTLNIFQHADIYDCINNPYNVLCDVGCLSEESTMQKKANTPASPLLLTFWTFQMVILRSVLVPSFMYICAHEGLPIRNI